MKLYYSPGVCSLAPHILLREANLPFELVRVDGDTKKTADGRDFLAINPNGYVPVLEIEDGVFLTEGPAIMQYIGDLAPATGLVPPNGTLDRYRQQSWLNFITSEIHKGFSPLFHKETPVEYKAQARAQLHKRLGYVDAQLAGKSFLMGETFTAADAYLYVTSGWAGFVGVDVSTLTNLLGFRTRVGSRPAVKAALAAEHKPK